MIARVHLPEVRHKLQPDAAEPVGSTPEGFTVHLKSEVPRRTKVVTAAGIKVEQDRQRRIHVHA